MILIRVSSLPILLLDGKPSLTTSRWRSSFWVWCFVHVAANADLASRYCIHWPSLDRTIDLHTEHFVSNRTSLPVCIRRQQAAPRVPRSITLRLPLFHHLRRMKNGLPYIIDVLTVDFYAHENAYDVDIELQCTLLYKVKWSPDKLHRHANERFNLHQVIITRLLLK